MLIDYVPKFLTALLFRSFEAREAFLAQVEELRNKYPRRPLAFVLSNSGVVEFLALRLFFQERYGKSFELRLATRLPGFFIEKPENTFRHIAAFLRLSERPPSRIRRCSEELKEGRPVLLNFEGSERRQAFEASQGEKDLAYLSLHNSDLILVPVSFVWRRKRLTIDGERGLSERLLKGLISPWTLILGDPYQPTGLRKVLIMLRQYANSTLRLTEEFDISSFNPKVLRRKILMTLLREKKTILGPAHPATKMVSESILRNPKFQQLVEDLAAEKDVSTLSLYKQAEHYFFEMAARYSYFVIEIGVWVLAKVFSTIFEGITMRDSDFEKLREYSRQGPIVFVPCHRSYVDFLLLSYVLYTKSLAPPHVAAGLNMNFWPVGRFFRGGGAFFIRRSFRGNVLYAEVLRRYIATLLDNGINLEFFLEGARSRNGKLAPPKFGMLKMIVESRIEELIQSKVNFVPVSIVYDRVTEDQAHRRELEGGEKVQESVIGVVKSSRVLFRKYGKVHLRFAEAIPLDPWIEKQIGEGVHSLDTRRLGTQKLAFEICHRINSEIPLTSVGLVAAVLLTKPDSQMTRSELEQWLTLIQKDILAHKIPLTPDLEADFMKACRRGMARMLDDKIIEKVHGGDKSISLRISPKQRIAALYYKNAVFHAFLSSAIGEISRGQIEESLELRGLLQFEFFFPDKEIYVRQITHQKHENHHGLYALMLDDVLENILLGLSALIHSQGLWLDAKEWRNRLMKFGKSSLQSRLALRSEAVNTQSFGAFIELAQNKGWLKKNNSPSIQQKNLLTPTLPAEIVAVQERIIAYKRRLPHWEQLVQKNGIRT